MSDLHSKEEASPEKEKVTKPKVVPAIPFH